MFSWRNLFYANVTSSLPAVFVINCFNINNNVFNNVNNWPIKLILCGNFSKSQAKNEALFFKTPAKIFAKHINYKQTYNHNKAINSVT